MGLLDILFENRTRNGNREDSVDSGRLEGAPKDVIYKHIKRIMDSGNDRRNR